MNALPPGADSVSVSLPQPLAGRDPDRNQFSTSSAPVLFQTGGADASNGMWLCIPSAAARSAPRRVSVAFPDNVNSPCVMRPDRTVLCATSSRILHPSDRSPSSADSSSPHSRFLPRSLSLISHQSSNVPASVHKQAKRGIGWRAASSGVNRPPPSPGHAPGRVLPRLFWWRARIRTYATISRARAPSARPSAILAVSVRRAWAAHATCRGPDFSETSNLT